MTPVSAVPELPPPTDSPLFRQFWMPGRENGFMIGDKVKVADLGLNSGRFHCAEAGAADSHGRDWGQNLG